MTGIDVTKNALASTQFLFNSYLSDLSDDDLLVHPAPGANNIAWQLGHLISSESGILADQIPNASYPDVPDELKNEWQGKSAENQDPPSGYRSKDEYVALFNTLRDATIANVDKLTDADLDKPTTGPLAQMAPTLGALLILTANHTMMHAAQFTVLRRKLGKPVLF